MIKLIKGRVWPLHWIKQLLYAFFGILLTGIGNLLMGQNLSAARDDFQQNITTVNKKDSSGNLNQADPYTLQECIAFAHENNKEIINASLQKRISKMEVGETRAEGLPQLNGNIRVDDNIAVPKSFIPAQFIDPENGKPGEYVPVQFGTQFSGNAGINVSQMIFDGSFFVGLQAAKTYRELSTKDHIRTKRDVTEAVTKAYYTVLVNQERIELVNQNYHRLDTLLRETIAMYENGFAEKIDVDRIRVQFNNSRTERKSVERLLNISYSQLKFQMGMSLDKEIQLAGKIRDINFTNNLNYGDYNYANRIEYSKLQTSRTLEQLDLKNNYSRYLPRFNIIGNVGFNSGTNKFNELFNFQDNWFKNAAIGLQIEIPIFDGLLKSYRIQKNKLQLEQVNNQFERLEKSIDLEVRQSRNNLLNSIEALEIQKENMELARDVYETAKIKYQEGIGSNIEVINAQTSFKEAETNYFNALYNALIDKVDLERAMGIMNENL